MQNSQSNYREPAITIYFLFRGGFEALPNKDPPQNAGTERFISIIFWFHFSIQVSTTNDVKIYNLSAGKSLPDWLTDRKKRQLVTFFKKHNFQHELCSSPKVKADVEVRKRIELIQDFEMPAISDRLKVTALNGESSILLQFQHSLKESPMYLHRFLMMVSMCWQLESTSQDCDATTSIIWEWNSSAVSIARWIFSSLENITNFCLTRWQSSVF